MGVVAVFLFAAICIYYSYFDFICFVFLMRVRISDLLMNSLSVLKSNILCKASVSSVLV